MSAASRDWIGQTIGRDRYRITGRLGDGGMGSVYRAWDASLATDVVVKVPRRSLTEEDRSFGERFQQEIRSLVQLSHPHVVRILDVGEHDGLPFAVMQFLGGGSLEQRRRRDAQGRPLPLAPLTLHEWLLPIAQALDYIHSRGYVHRDIKPANILFDGINHPFLSDFGLAKVVAAGEASQASRMTRTGMVLGTPHYMAPELVLGKPYDGRVDQYALAVTIHELLSCRMPIDAPTPAAVLVQQTAEPASSLVEALPQVDTALAETLLRALEKSPDERYPNCTEFAEAILTAAGAKPKPGDIPKVTVGRVTSSEEGKIPCPSCGKLIGLSEKARGKRTWCPGCRVAFQISSDLTELRELVEALPLVYQKEPNSASSAETYSLETPAGGNDAWQTRAMSAAEVQKALSGEQASPATTRADGKSTRWLLISGMLLGLLAIGVLWRESIVSRLASGSAGNDTNTPIPPPPLPPVKPIITPIPDLELAFDEPLVVSLKVENSAEVGAVRYEWQSPPPIPAQLDPDTGVITSDPSASRPAGAHVLKLRAVQIRSETASDLSVVVVKIKPPRNALTPMPAEVGSATSMPIIDATNPSDIKGTGTTQTFTALPSAPLPSGSTENNREIQALMNDYLAKASGFRPQVYLGVSENSRVVYPAIESAFELARSRVGMQCLAQSLLDSARFRLSLDIGEDISGYLMPRRFEPTVPVDVNQFLVQLNLLGTSTYRVRDKDVCINSFRKRWTGEERELNPVYRFDTKASIESCNFANNQEFLETIPFAFLRDAVDQERQTAIALMSESESVAATVAPAIYSSLCSFVLDREYRAELRMLDAKTDRPTKYPLAAELSKRVTNSRPNIQYAILWLICGELYSYPVGDDYAAEIDKSLRPVLVHCLKSDVARVRHAAACAAATAFSSCIDDSMLATISEMCNATSVATIRTGLTVASAADITNIRFADSTLARLLQSTESWWFDSIDVPERIRKFTVDGKTCVALLVGLQTTDGERVLSALRDKFPRRNAEIALYMGMSGRVVADEWLGMLVSNVSSSGTATQRRTAVRALGHQAGLDVVKAQEALLSFLGNSSVRGDVCHSLLAAEATSRSVQEALRRLRSDPKVDPVLKVLLKMR